MNITNILEGDAIISGDHPELMRNELLHDLFGATVVRFPDRTAIRSGETVMTYRQLDERTNRLATYLREQGLRCEDRVAILLPRCELVYVAMLAVLKAGAAYVPLDPDIPVERAEFILEDSSAKFLVTDSALAKNFGAGTRVLCLDKLELEISRRQPSHLNRAETGVRPENLCYVIYTSGTTGRPKGVLVEHRNVTHLVRAESLLYGIHPDDCVLQLASVAFDASVEEIWAAFFHGATLEVCTAEVLHSGDEFPDRLAQMGVTVLSCVPTFLSMVTRDIPTVRLLIFGGEVCPAELAARWHRKGRAVFNTYGPTETTVIATAARLGKDLPVTIGRPIANYQVYLLDEAGSPVEAGAVGEICVAGAGVVRGYLNRPELEAEKFVVTEALTGSPLRLYRTGDLASFNAQGELSFLGRKDDQVKVRGFRIELSEIEEVIGETPGVIAAAAAVDLETQGIAAYVVLGPGKDFDRAALRKTLAERLPSYMVPAFVDVLPALPLTSSGKIDRKKLPKPQTALHGTERIRVAPRDDRERAVAEVWRAVLKREDVSVSDDFFLDLSGHSLLAAVAVSKLRLVPGFERISMADFYKHRTVEQLARRATVAVVEGKGDDYQKIPRHRYILCAIGQVFGVLLLSGIYAGQWLGAYLTYGYLAVADWPVNQALGLAFLTLCATTPVTLAFSILLKWVLLGRVKPGNYPLWGWFYFRFWLVRAVVRASPLHYLEGSPYLNLYYRLMGARIGRNVFIGSQGLATFDVLSVGDGTSIGMDSSIDGSAVESGKLKIGPVTIGRNCWIGSRCALGTDVVMEDGAGLDDLSMLPDGTRVPAGAFWRGSPATPAGRLEPEETRPPWTAAAWGKHLVGIFLFPIIIMSAILPGVIAVTEFGHVTEGYFFLFAAPLVALSFVVFLCAELWLCKWLLVGRLRPGRYDLGGSYYVRKWFVDQLMTMTTDVTEAFYETLFVTPWLRALGARIGRRCEVAALDLVHPDLLELGDECMLADLGILGAQRVRSGWLTLDRVKIGKRVFIGNSAVLPPGTKLGDNVLIGLMSTPPKVPGVVEDGTSWFGSPPMHLPIRYRSDQFTEARTYRPPRKLVALRLFIEFFRVLIPLTLFVAVATLIVDTTDILQDYIGLGTWILTVPFLYVVAGILGVLATALIKWIVVGRYREGEKPLWSHFVWRNDLVNAIYSNFCRHFFLDLLCGTPFIAWALRLFGMKVGKRCYVDTTWFTEFDLIEIGDDVALNDRSNVQTHLFEDRVIKMGLVSIGDRCSLGSASTILYNTRMEDGATLGELSLLMKGESLRAGTHWHGIPCEQVE